MTSLWHHGPCYDVIGFPYIRRHAWPVGASYLTWELRVHFTLVPNSTAGYSCTLGLMHWRVPTSGAYFLRLYLIGLLLLWASSPSVDATKHADTSHECYLEYFMRRPHRTDLLFGWCPWALFRLYKSTSSEAYHHWGDTSSSRVAHITILASLGGPQSIENGPIHGKHSTLAETQVC